MTGRPGSDALPNLLLLRVIHGGMVAALVVYAGIAHLLDTLGVRTTPLPPDTLRLLRWPLYGLGGATLAGILAVRGRLVSRDALAEVARRQGAAVARARYQARLIVLLALTEGVALFGFLLVLLGGPLADFYGLGGSALLVMLLLAPSSETWEALDRPGPG